MSAILKLPYPISVNRYYRIFKGMSCLSREGREFKRDAYFLNRNVKKLVDDVELAIKICPKATKSGEPYKRCIDIDNGLKCTLDALNGLAYIDDVQVRRLIVEYGEQTPNGAALAKIGEFRKNIIYWDDL